jgi:anthranilate synthase component 1
MKAATNKNASQRKTTVPPAVLSFCSDIGTPVAIFEKLSRDETNAFLFESTEGDSRLARYSFLGVDPCLTISFSDGIATSKTRDNLVEQEPVKNPVEYLEQVLANFRRQLLPDEQNTEKDDHNKQKAVAKLFAGNTNLPFFGGLVGYMGYGASHYLDRIPKQTKDVVKVADGFYGLYDSGIVFDHQYRRVTVVSLKGQSHALELVKRISAPAGLPPLPISQKVLAEDEIFENVESSFSKDDFIAAVKQAKQFIIEGQVFQIVLSQRFSTETTAHPIDIYRMLTATNPSPYAYYLKGPGFVYLGSSPETFVQCRDGQLLLRALAGTRRRGTSAEEDEALARELKNDEKEMAEHRMLVDLGRNDLGRICQPGSIRVGEIAFLTKYTHVMHLATEITGTLDGASSCFDAFHSCFPAGTVSGAPKVRAMQLLSSLEPERRGVYAGSVGYFDLNGNMDGAIAIRSVLIKDKVAHVNAGAGLVFDSQPEMEYQETRNKAKSVLQAIKLAERTAL